jgi:DHA3 family macrolide efflux protein-like MFS transporter
MRTFLIIWIGQLASLLGSEMTNFAITIWAWEVTGKATPLSLILFFTQTPRVIAALFAGVLVDRTNRKKLMIVGDLMAGCSTIALLVLLSGDRLEIWHLYFTGGINSLFGFFQGLAYSTTLSSIVPKQHYARVSAFNSIQTSGSYILAPALAGSLYPSIGLVGILVIDLVTFAIAIATIVFIPIPQLKHDRVKSQTIENLRQELTFGFRYLFKYPSLLALLVFLLLDNLLDNINFAILPAMILARSGNNSAVWGRLLTMFGIGSLLGAATIGIWGGSKRRIHGLLLGSAIRFLGSIAISVSQTIYLKIAAALICGFCSPFPDSSDRAIWMSKVKPDIQGRVFAARDVIAQITAPLGAAIAGILADRFFEPAMRTGGSLVGIFGGVFGTQIGAGMALMITLFASCGLLLGLGGYAFPLLRDVEEIVADYDSLDN